MKKIISAIIIASLASSLLVPVYADGTNEDTGAAAAAATPSPTATIDPEKEGNTPATSPRDDEEEEDYDVSFSDISGSNYSWAYDSIMNMAEKGYVSGYEDGTYRPDNSVTRLEVLALFARAMGSRDEVNEPILELAHEMYDETIQPYSLIWGTDEIAYLMYRGVLQRSDLDTYLKGTLKDEPMPRHEAAIIITKAMGGEQEATSTVGISLDYADVNTIPKASLQYVNYVTEEGIMTGMDNNCFSPQTSVLRSQMAVMLERVDTKTDYTFEQSRLIEVDTDNEEVTVLDEYGDEITLPYTDDTSFRMLGELVQPEDMVENLSVLITYSAGDIFSIDAMTDVPDETVTGIYMSNTSSGGAVKTITIRPDSGSDQRYQCADDLEITYNGSPANLGAFVREQDYITLTLEGGLVTAVTGSEKDETITNATIEEITIEPEFTMTISHADGRYDGMTYPIADDVLVFKNDAECSFSDIYRGDKVTLTLEYGEITKVRATASKRIVEGSIVALNIAAQSSMTVRSGGTETTYDIPNSVEITINGESGTLYDFRVGDTVKLTLESQAIVAITATHIDSTEGTISGTITAVNSAFGFIKVSVSEDYEETIYCTDRTTILDTTGKEQTLRSIEVGQVVVTATGTTTNGAFSADLVVVK